jgi:hypothetical protein
MQERAPALNDATQPHPQLRVGEAAATYGDDNPHGLEQPTDLLQPDSDDEQRCWNRQQLLSEKGTNRQHYSEVGNSSAVMDHRDRDNAELMAYINETRRVLMRTALMRATGISDPELADSYIYAASQDASADKPGEQWLPHIIQKVETLGPEKLTRLRQYNGLYALSYYTLEQLELMAQLANRDPAVIAH